MQGQSQTYECYHQFCRLMVHSFSSSPLCKLITPCTGIVDGLRCWPYSFASYSIFHHLQLFRLVYGMFFFVLAIYHHKFIIIKALSQLCQGQLFQHNIYNKNNKSHPPDLLAKSHQLTRQENCVVRYIWALIPKLTLHTILSKPPFCLVQLGYVIYRRVLRYYSGEEDGLGESNLPHI